jgi:hypothetical protein
MRISVGSSPAPEQRDVQRGGLRQEAALARTKLVITPKAAAWVAESGGEIWVWLDHRRGVIGSYVWLEAHCEAPRTSRRTSFTRSARQPHRFRTMRDGSLTVHYDWGRLDPPEELHFDVKGWRKGTRRLEAYWNGCVFAGDDVPPPHATR